DVALDLLHFARVACEAELAHQLVDARREARVLGLALRAHAFQEGLERAALVPARCAGERVAQREQGQREEPSGARGGSPAEAHAPIIEAGGARATVRGRRSR